MTQRHILAVQMKAFAKYIAGILVNRVAMTAMASRIVQAAGWIVAIPLITTHLTAAEQGYYYTFASLAALQVFVELGMTGVLVQSLAHEAAHLKLEGTAPAPFWSGPIYHRARMASILRFAAWWFGIAGICAALALATGGCLFMTSIERTHPTNVLWTAPWLTISIITGATVWTAGTLSILEGLGSIGAATTIRLIASIFGLMGLILGLVLGAGLWSVAINLGLTVVISLAASCYRLRKPLLASTSQRPDPEYCWKTEIWPFQWRIALSWVSGWFIFQAMTPALMQTSGPEIAGRFGIALQIANGIQTLSGVWTQIRVPAWGMMIARSEWTELDHDFRKWVLASLGSSILGTLIVVNGIWWIDVHKWSIHDRLPSLWMILPLLGVAILNQWVFAIAAYLRAHRKEPFLAISIFMAIIMFLGLQLPPLVQAQTLPIFYATATFIIAGITGTKVWISCRLAWHKYTDSTQVHIH